MSVELQGDLLRRILGIGSGRDQEISALDAATVRLTSGSAFALALEKRFGEEATADEARLFVERIRGRWIKAEALNPVLAEHVIMAMYEDANLLGSVPAVDVIAAQNMLTYAMVNDLNITGDALDEFIRESLELANDSADEVD